jgi:hypothetical protein
MTSVARIARARIRVTASGALGLRSPSDVKADMEGGSPHLTPHVGSAGIRRRSLLLAIALCGVLAASAAALAVTRRALVDDPASGPFSGIECGREQLGPEGGHHVPGRTCLLRAFTTGTAARFVSSAAGMDGLRTDHVYIVDSQALELWHRETSAIGVPGPWQRASCEGMTANEDWDGTGVGPPASVFVHHGCVDEP